MQSGLKAYLAMWVRKVEMLPVKKQFFIVTPDNRLLANCAPISLFNLARVGIDPLFVDFKDCSDISRTQTNLALAEELQAI
jgi:D-mannonate dehydratase